jgi:tRNA(Ile)-lysidine synthase
MKKKIQQYINQHFLIAHNEKIIVGVSGGADSVALIHILRSLNYNCIIAHCNFHLRDEESMRDEFFVTQLAQQYNSPFFNIDFQTKEYASQNKISIEMAARDLRYAWFEQLRIQENANYIAVAHHADDVVETVLMNLTRGTGIDGLTGIKPQNGHVIRPFLGITRADIMQYITDNKLSFVLDSTNKNVDFLRNKFRNQIIPIFEKINPSFTENLRQTIEQLNDVAGIYNNYINDVLQKIVTKKDEDIYLSIEKLKNETAIKSILYEIIKDYGFNSSQAINILKNIDASSGKQYFSANYRLVKDREFLIINKTETQIETIEINSADTQLSSPINLLLQKTAMTDDFNIDKSPNVAYFDFDKLKYPLTIRHWQEGDFFYPFGMTNKKKLSDFFIDKKINLHQKEKTWLLVSDNQIIWIVGQRTDDRFKITDKTKFILKITC